MVRARINLVALTSIGFGLAAWACSSFGERTEDVAPPDAATDAAEVDDMDAGLDATPDARVNLLRDPGFELGCAEWQNTNGSAMSSAEPRTGSSACTLCKTTSSLGLAAHLIQNVQMPVAPGDSFVGFIWARVPDGGNPPARHELLINTAIGDQASRNMPPASGTWTEGSVAQTSGDGGVRVQLIYRFYGDAGTCMIVDDAALFKQ